MRSPSKTALFTSFTAAATLTLACLACSSSDSPASSNDGQDAGARGVEPAGQACTAPAQCYAGVTAEGGTIVGDVTCLTKVTNGYCTHTCAQDTDCCAVPGECRTDVKEVCSPFENQGLQYCFLSCEDADVQRAIAANGATGLYDGGATDAGSVADAYCKSYAGASTSCRSSGGGTKNRKVCVPNE